MVAAAEVLDTYRSVRKTYLISDVVDYSRLISPDAGPAYAMNMGWAWRRLSEITVIDGDVLIVDNRISEKECLVLEPLIRQTNATIVLKIVDPLYEWKNQHWYYRFLFRISQAHNVLFLSNYVPAELIDELDRLTGRRKMLFLPFPLREWRKPLGPFGERSRKILFSGAGGKATYPLRYAFARHVTWRPWLRLRVAFLSHPGYPDIGQALKHDVIGERYLEYLSRFAFMFLCPSRAGLELLKYGECAAARCVPLGQAPKSFSERMRRPFIEVEEKALSRSLRRALSIPTAELCDRSMEYHRAFAAERNPAILNATFDAFVCSTR